MSASKISIFIAQSFSLVIDAPAMINLMQAWRAVAQSPSAGFCYFSFISWGIVSCASEDQEPGRLIDHDLWVLSPVGEDPFINEQGERPACDESALSWEVDGFEVSTETCGYLTVEQPIGTALRKGDQLQLDLSWGSLLAATPALAIIEFRVAGEPLFHEEIAIPSSADIRSFVLTSPIAADAGTTLYFHIRNHGTNSYKLRDLAFVP